MKLLKNQTLLFDDNCPLCSVYTRGVISAGMLDENGKKPYCQLSVDERKFVDLKRAANEIALVDNENKTVIYGIDSLLKVIGFSFPWMEKVGKIKPVNFFLKKLYQLISFNRKVIVPSRKNKETELHCVPDFNEQYRWLYVLLSILVSSYLFFKYLNSCDLNYAFTFVRVLVFSIILITINILLTVRFKKEEVLTWIGNYQTSILIGAILLMPVYVANYLFEINNSLKLSILIFSFLFIVCDSYRRFKIIRYNN